MFKIPHALRSVSNDQRSPSPGKFYVRVQNNMRRSLLKKSLCYLLLCAKRSELAGLQIAFLCIILWSLVVTVCATINSVVQRCGQSKVES